MSADSPEEPTQDTRTADEDIPELIRRAETLCRRGAYQHAHQCYVQALKIAEARSDEAAAIQIFEEMGDHLFLANESWEMAAQFFEKARSLAPSRLDEATSVRLMIKHGVALSAMGGQHLIPAMGLLNEATGKVDGQREPALKLMSWGNLGNVFQGLGMIPMAMTYYREAIEMAEALGNPAEQAAWLNNLGGSHLMLEDYEGAGELFERAEALLAPLVGEDHPRRLALKGHLHKVRQILAERRAAIDKLVQEVASGIEAMETAVFFGAGISAEAGLPLSKELFFYLLEKLELREEDRKVLAEGYWCLEDVLSLLRHRSPTDWTRLLAIFESDRPTAAHRLLARLASAGYLKTLVTTNLDTLLEQALQQQGLTVGHDFSVLASPRELEEIDWDTSKIRVLKIHGSVDRPAELPGIHTQVVSSDPSEPCGSTIDRLFSSGPHRNVLVLGYSASDSTDVEPQIAEIEQDLKRVVYVAHSDRAAVGPLSKLKAFERFENSQRLSMDTSAFLSDLSNRFYPGESGARESEPKPVWPAVVDAWFEANLKKTPTFVLSLAGDLLGRIEEPERAIPYYEKGLELDRSDGRDGAISAWLVRLVESHERAGKIEGAIEYLQRALEADSGADEWNQRTDLEAWFLRLLRKSESPERALELCETRWEAASCSGEPREIARALLDLGVVRSQLRDVEGSEEALQRALEIAQESSESTLVARISEKLGALRIADGRTEEAIPYYESMLRIMEERNDATGTRVALSMLSHAHFAKMQPEGFTYGFRALGVAREQKNRVEEANLLSRLASVGLITHDFELALLLHREFLALPGSRLSQTLVQHQFVLEQYRSAAETALENGEAAKAHEYLTMALALHEREEAKDGAEKAHLLEGLGEASVELRDYRAARDHYLNALVASADGDKGRIHGKLGTMYLRSGDYEKAIGYYDRALEGVESLPEASDPVGREFWEGRARAQKRLARQAREDSTRGSSEEAAASDSIDLPLPEELIEVIARELESAGKTVVFCGAGISFDSGLPVVAQLVPAVLEQLGMSEPEVRKLKQSDLRFEAFMEILRAHSDIDPLLQIYEAGEPNNNHRFLARLLVDGRVKTLCTTNFDSLIEKALQQEGWKENRDYDLVYREEDFEGIRWDESKPRLIKIHGGVQDQESMAITLSQVASNLLALPRQEVIDHLFAKGGHDNVLVLGYSSSDLSDINPQIELIDEGQKRVFYLQHSEDRAVHDLRAAKDPNPYRRFAGSYRLLYTTGEAIETWWPRFSPDQEYRPQTSETAWHEKVIEWFQQGRSQHSEAFRHQSASTLFAAIQEYEQALEYAANALESVRESGDRGKECELRLQIGTMLFKIGNYEESLATLREARDIATWSDDQKALSLVLAGIGDVYFARDEYSEAREAFERARFAARKGGDTQLEMMSGGRLGLVALRQGNFSQAEKRLRETLDWARNMGIESEEAAYLGNLGSLAAEKEDYEEAERFYRRAVEISLRNGDRRGQANALGNLGDIFSRQERFGEAQKHLVEALKIAEAIHDSEKQQLWLGALGNTATRRGDFLQARDFYERSLKVSRRLGSRVIEGITRGNLGGVSFNSGDYRQALDHFREAVSILVPLLGANHPQVQNPIQGLKQTQAVLQHLEATAE